MGLIPKFISNVETKFADPELPYLFKCKGKGFDLLVVNIYASDSRHNPEIITLEGPNTSDADPNILSNIKKIDKSLIFELFNMARCRREFDRTDNRDYLEGYEFYRQRAINKFNDLNPKK